MTIFEVEGSNWALNTFVSIPYWSAVWTPCALIDVIVPILILLT
jgi:hypothetical protein